MRGLICWLDARDGSGTQTDWVDKSGNGNNATLKNFNFDANSGWTGKGLKFDAINDFLKFTKKIKGVSFEFTVRNLKLNQNSNSYLIDKRTISNTTVYFSNMVNDRINVLGGYFVESSFYQNNTSPNIKTIGFVAESDVESDSFVGCRNNLIEFLDIEILSIKIYNRILTEVEIQQNYEYEKAIDRTTPTTYPMLPEEKTYGIGLASQLSEGQLSTFRLSVDKTKFVAGLRYCGAVEVEKYTYSEILEIMGTKGWKSEEIEV